jgi:hypothetical protein
MNPDSNYIECCVCTENIYKKTKLICGHHIHKECIIKSGKNECPICRKNVLQSKKDKELCLQYKIDLRINELKENNPYLTKIGLNNKILFDILKNYF